MIPPVVRDFRVYARITKAKVTTIAIHGFILKSETERSREVLKTTDFGDVFIKVKHKNKLTKLWPLCPFGLEVLEMIQREELDIRHVFQQLCHRKRFIFYFLLYNASELSISDCLTRVRRLPRP
jgi:hypothetical protein